MILSVDNEIDMTIAAVVVISMSVLLGAMISGVFGMAGGLILLFVLLQYFSVGTALVTHAAVQFFTNLFRVGLNHRHVNLNILGFYSLGNIIAFVLFQFISISLDKQMLMLSLGGVAVFTPFLKRSPINVLNKRATVVFGFIIASLQYSIGVSGPLFNVAFLDEKLKKDDVIATKAAIAVVSLFFKTIYFLPLMLRQNMEDEMLMIAPLLLVMSFTGTEWAQSLRRKLNEKSFLVSGRILVSLIGFVCLWKAI
jgi:hypothetical protein